MPVAHVRRFSLCQQVARRGDAVKPDRDRVLAGRGPRQTTLAPEREALTQRVVHLALGTGGAPGLVRIEATESKGGHRIGQGTRRLDPRFGRLGFEVHGPQLGVVFQHPAADRLEAVPRDGFGCGHRQRQRPQGTGEHAGKQVPERWPTAEQRARVQAPGLHRVEQGCHISVLGPTRRRSLGRGRTHAVTRTARTHSTAPHRGVRSSQRSGIRSAGEPLDGRWGGARRAWVVHPPMQTKPRDRRLRSERPRTRRATHRQ